MRFFIAITFWSREYHFINSHKYKTKMRTDILHTNERVYCKDSNYYRVSFILNIKDNRRDLYNFLNWTYRKCDAWLFQELKVLNGQLQTW